MHLPQEFKELEEILDEMPLIKKDGTPGLLAKDQLGRAVEALPEYNVEHITDQALLMGTILYMSTTEIIAYHYIL